MIDRILLFGDVGVLDIFGLLLLRFRDRFKLRFVGFIVDLVIVV